MKIAILGTKGIPNNYGGYEQFAELFSRKMVERGHAVTVYNPGFHPYQGSSCHGVSIIRKYSPERWMGGAANFVYDYLCLRDALQRDFDIIYEAGYHSVAPSYKILGIRRRSTPIVLTNMDGLEYLRSKWNGATRLLIRKLERIAVAESHYLISDNRGIQEYYEQNFGKDSFYVPYGADPVSQFDKNIPGVYGLEPNNYAMLVARMEPENNIEMILDGQVASTCPRPFVVVGNAETAYGRFLRNKYAQSHIRFLGGIYDKPVLDALRHFASMYFHGHSVGGTNPSLLEAMACGCFIAAHDNVFNRSVLGGSAFFFKASDHVRDLLNGMEDSKGGLREGFRLENESRLANEFNWNVVVTRHEELFVDILARHHSEKR